MRAFFALLSRNWLARLLLVVLSSLVSAYLLQKAKFGDIGSLAAFLIAAGASWFSGPMLSLLGPLIILHFDRYQRIGAEAFTTAYTAQELTNWSLVTLVMFTVGWAGKLTRKSLQESRQSEALLREQAEHKDRFLATLAHELRNPLSPLLSAVEILQLTDDAAPDPAEVRELHKTMRRQVEHLIRLVDDLLDINRISAGKITLRKERTSIQEILKESVDAVRHQILAAKHHLHLSVPDEPLFVEGDRTRLVQVITNLLSNAVKFTPSSGNLSLEASASESIAVITVSDSGVGIAPADLPRVFEMFAQIDNSLRSTNRGLGIGLSLSRRLIEMHDGVIEAHSSGVGAGSMFVIRLPCARNLC